MNIQRIALLIVAHQSTEDRHEKLLYCLKGINNLYSYGLAEIDVFLVHDYPEDLARYVDLPDNHTRVIDITISNKMPLADRHNLALDRVVQYADRQGREYDYLMQLGSDDILTHEGFMTAVMWMMQGCKFGAFVKVGIVSPCISKMVYHGGLGNMGAGRFVAWDLIMKTRAVRPVWTPGKMKGLDGSSEKNITVVTRALCYPINTYQPCVFDLKSDDNLHTYQKFAEASGVERPFNIENILA
jgi:hypothetical protein